MKLNYVKIHKRPARLMVKVVSLCQKRDSRLQKFYFSPIWEECTEYSDIA
jgi:hypothetical protein